MMKRLIQHPKVQAEGKKLIKFVLVGGTSFLIYFFAYLALSRFLFPESNKTLLNFISICVSTIFNFVAHRSWTYEVKERSMKQLIRYLLVVGSVAMLQAFLFWIGYEVLKVYDLLVTFFTAGICAMYSFVAHRLFTFREPKRVTEAQEQFDEAVL